MATCCFVLFVYLLGFKPSVFTGLLIHAVVFIVMVAESLFSDSCFYFHSVYYLLFYLRFCIMMTLSALVGNGSRCLWMHCCFVLSQATLRAEKVKTGI